MKRLFPVNELLTAGHAAVLKIIAAALECPGNAVYIGEGICVSSNTGAMASSRSLPDSTLPRFPLLATVR